MCFKSVEFNVEATKMRAEIQLTHQLLHESVNKVTAGVAVMKSNAGKMKLVKSQGIISDPVVCDTTVNTSENEDFKF